MVLTFPSCGNVIRPMEYKIYPLETCILLDGRSDDCLIV